MMSAIRIAIFVLFVTLGILSEHGASSITVSVNETLPALEDVSKDEDSKPDESDEAELLERYRRLIPYMTYYVMNNYINSQQPQYQQQTESPVLRRPQSSSPAPGREYGSTLRPVQLIKASGRYQTASQLKEGRFVPSVQYNPNDVGPEADYFVPVRYGPKDPVYEDYGAAIRTTRPRPDTIADSRYQTTARPLHSFLPQQKLKLTPAKLQQQDYVAYNQQQAPEEFESVRFAKLRQQEPVHYVQQQQQPVVQRPTILEPVLPQAPTQRVSLNHVLKSLQLTNQLPEVLSKDNIDSSIKTLVEILNILNMGKKENFNAPGYGKFKPIYTKPKVITESNYEATQISVTPYQELVEIRPPSSYINLVKNPHVQVPQKEIVEITPRPQEEIVEIKPRPHINQYKTQMLAPLQTTVRPSIEQQKIVEYYVPIIQDIDKEKPLYNQASKEPSIPQSTEESTGTTYNEADNHDEILEDERYTLPITTEEPVQKLPAPVHTIPPSLKYGATRGKPHVDYPAYTEIPETDFSCKQQRYKGFFGDPATGCQVWHYCDLNGGKSSFLCPNGTIFSQVALTCDWWFNVKCESTPQLYVLNERLYKYILPIVPKFPEDFSGPEVDKYLELKFKEMEAKLKEKKKKKEEEEKDKNGLNTLQSIEDSK